MTSSVIKFFPGINSKFLLIFLIQYFMISERPMPKFGILPSALIFIGAAILLYLASHFLIPFLASVTGQEMILFWFIVAGLIVFTPLILLAFHMLRNEGYRIFDNDTWRVRMRFRKLTRRDMIWSFSGLVLTGLCSALILEGVTLIWGEFDHSPVFMSFEPLTKGRYWLLLVWLPYWVLNIMGEEIIWRGVILPRQELSFGRYAWLIHGLGWSLFHFAFGWQLVLSLLPLMFFQSYIVQRTGNSWVGVIMHGGLNGPAFIAIALGMI